MELLDEQGRVFGLVNVIDLLAALFAFAVVVAGVAVVFSGGSSDQPELGTRYVTLDLGDQPAYVTERISAGDVAPAPNSPGNATVTDVYVTPTEDQSSRVTVRARIRGQPQSGSERAGFAFAGDALVLGRTLNLETAEYRVSGTVTEVAREGESLPVSTTDVVIQTRLPAEVAAAVSVGQQYRANGQTLATVESKTVYPGNNEFNRRVYLGLSLRTLRRQGQARFGGGVVRPGRDVSVAFGPYDITGTVREFGRTSLSGEMGTTTAVVKLSNVSPERANDVREGMTETMAGTQYAAVQSVRSEPTEVVLQSQDGNIYVREHPRNVDVYVTVDLRTRRTGSGLRFHGQPLRLNGEVTLLFDSVTVQAEVVEVQQ